MRLTRRLLAAITTVTAAAVTLGVAGPAAMADLVAPASAVDILPLPGGGDGDGDSGDGGSGDGGSEPLLPLLPQPTPSPDGGGDPGGGGDPTQEPSPSPTVKPSPNPPAKPAAKKPSEEDRVLLEFERSPVRYNDNEAPAEVVQATLAVQRVDALIRFYNDRLAKDRAGLTTAQTWMATAPVLGDLEKRYAELTSQLEGENSAALSALERAGLLAERMSIQMQADVLRTKLAESQAALPVLQKRIPGTQQRLTQLAAQRVIAFAALRAAAPSDLEQNQARLLSSSRLAMQIRSLSRALNANGRSVNGTGDFARPATGPVTSPYGHRHHPILNYRKMHTGIDIGRGDGFIYAADRGVVLMTVRNGGYGLLTVVDHGSIAGQRIATLYAHQSKFLVEPGQRVGKGQRIGVIGSTGLSTGPHLHFEVRDFGDILNPHPWLRRVL